MACGDKGKMRMWCIRQEANEKEKIIQFAVAQHSRVAATENMAQGRTVRTLGLPATKLMFRVGDNEEPLNGGDRPDTFLSWRRCNRLPQS